MVPALKFQSTHFGDKITNPWPYCCDYVCLHEWEVFTQETVDPLVSSSSLSYWGN